MWACQEEIISWGQKPCNYQLPFSLYYLINPSATLFASWQMKTSSTAFYSSSPCLSITASQWYRSFSCLPPCLPSNSNSKCNGTLAKQCLKTNNELTTVLHPFSQQYRRLFFLSLYLKNSSDCSFLSFFIPPFHFSSLPDHVQHLCLFFQTNKQSKWIS